MTPKEQDAQFKSWLKEHLSLMLKVVRGSVALPADQEDLLQDILVNLWSSISNFRGDCKATTWIYRVSIQTAMGWHRGERRRHKRQALFQKEVASRTPPTCVTPTANDELIERLYAAIRQLPKVDASIALMHLDGLSYQEIADVVGISENYLGVKLTRIRKQLADLLGPAEDGDR